MPVSVCILTSVHSAFDTRIFHKEAKTLKSAGYSVSIVAQHRGNEIVDDINIIAIPIARNRIERMILTTYRILRVALRMKARVYHFHDPELLLVGFLLRLMGYVVIYDVHEDYAKSIAFRTYIPPKLRTAVAECLFRLEDCLGRFFHAIVVATDDIKKNFPRQKVVAVRNYPILAGDSKRQNSKGNIYFVYVGSLSRANGITEIVRSMEHLTVSEGVKLILAGKFSPPEYEEEVRQLDGFKRVDYRGWIPFYEVSELMSSCDVGMVCCHPEPNSVNSLPNKMFEYMSVGLPVIASHFALWRDIIEKDYCGLCADPMRPDDVARAMQIMIGNPEMRRQMGENAKKAIENKYNWESEARSLLGLYRELLTND